MTSWSKDEDHYRLPEGMTRIGYDADTQKYHFHDRKDGSVWEGPEGSRYGKLRRISVGAGGDDRMFSSPDSSPVSNQRKISWSSASPSSPASPPPTDFDQILGNIRRERSVSEAGLKRESSSGPTALGSALRRSATVTSKLTRRLSRRISVPREEPLLEESRKGKGDYDI